ncbi:MAG TPA: hypothetical protein PK849_07950, partial [Synergistales bacterium]|nr:hypothetical protein [Synergistales bacterium]
ETPSNTGLLENTFPLFENNPGRFPFFTSSEKPLTPLSLSDIYRINPLNGKCCRRVEISGEPL